MTSDDISHAISSLNWISPSFDFDLADMTYDLMDTPDQYWDQTNDTTFSDQATATQTSPTRSDRTLPPETENTQGSYVEDAGARRPRSGRYANRVLGDESKIESRHSHPIDTFPLEDEPSSFAFEISEPIVLEFPVDSDLVTDDQYVRIIEHFHQLCISATSYTTDLAFTSTSFPSIAALRACTALYFRHFDPKVLPLIRRDASSTPSSQSWVLVLGMAAIGSQYLDTGSQSTALAMHEFLRRVLRNAETLSDSQSLSCSTLHVAQAHVLNHIGMSYSGSKTLQKHMTSSLKGLIQDFLYLHQHQKLVLQGTLDNPQDFFYYESIRRLCHTIWLLEVSSRYQFGTHPSLLLDFTGILLPCQEELWLSMDTTSNAADSQPTLERALTVLYVEKRLLKNVGDFARVLLIHAVYCQTWVIARSLSRSLLQWTPSAQKSSADSLTTTPWLPSFQRYNQWRNAACDCIDVLHWIANSDTAMTGTENTTTFHLHFSRIVLLTPYDAIRELVSLLISGAQPSDRARELVSTINRWILEDQFKARLAMVHCGVFFWHVRRYSVDAFYEPVAVYLTTLVVWAYGSLAPPRLVRRQRQIDNEESEYSSDVDKISSIRLDRPTDDELVQLFIKRGRGMRATLMGVGDVQGTKGPGRMLREGGRVLATLGRGKMGGGYARELGVLRGICGEGRDWIGRIGG